jgi:hypothetical protein
VHPRTDNLETCLPLEIRRYGDEFGCLGTLEVWDRIPELAKGNSRFMLAVALAFTGPVVELLQLESPPMIQLFGAPGSGKTSMGAAAGAAWGGGRMGSSCSLGTTPSTVPSGSPQLSIPPS